MMRFLLILVCIGTHGVGFGQKKTTISQWQKEPIVVDADLDDWVGAPSFYDKTTKLAYSISNDSSNIYLCFRISDQAMQMKALKVGLMVSLDTTGKKNQRPSINYPIGTDKFEPPSRGEKPDTEKLKNEFRKRPQNMMLNGFKEANGTLPTRDISGVAVKLDWDVNSDMIYEFTIPVASFWRESITPNDVSKVMSLNVRFAALERPSSGRGGRPGGGGRPAGVRPGGGGRPSWVGGSDSPDFQILFQEQKLRHRFSLVLSDSEM